MVKFSLKGINKAIKAVATVADTLPAKMRQLLETLMNEGWEIAAYGFSSALYAGTIDVSLPVPYWDGDTLILSANGESVAFIEFGTGTVYEDYPDKLPKGISKHGTYGKKKGEHPPWVYVGDAGDIGYVIGTRKDGKKVVKTYGNPPARAMYNAGKVFDREHIAQVAREVFHD